MLHPQITSIWTQHPDSSQKLAAFFNTQAPYRPYHIPEQIML